jgi:hypothetical protein
LVKARWIWTFETIFGKEQHDGIEGAGWRKSTIPFPYLSIQSFWNIYAFGDLRNLVYPWNPCIDLSSDSK